MFSNASSFNQDISEWDLSSNTSMSFMFYGSPFNQDISSWDVSNVTSMAHCFQHAEDFNQDLSTWDVSSVTQMHYMFYGASSFDQDLSGWNVSNVTDFSSMFENANALSDANKCAIHVAFQTNSAWPYAWCVQDCAGVWGGDAFLAPYWPDNDGDGLGAANYAMRFDSPSYISVSDPTSIPAGNPGTAAGTVAA